MEQWIHNKVYINEIRFVQIRKASSGCSNTYVIKASHSKKFSSFIGPAIIPSGGFKVNSASYALVITLLLKNDHKEGRKRVILI